MSTSDGHNVIQSIDVLYSVCTSDHIPICIDVSLELVPQVEGLSTHECQKICWDRVSDECIKLIDVKLSAWYRCQHEDV